MRPAFSPNVTYKSYAYGMIGVIVALTVALLLAPAAHAEPAAKKQTPIGGSQAAPAVTQTTTKIAAMPATQQNALVQKYCEVCHNDAYMNGGLTLQHFDAAHADPGDAAMMLAKLKTGAIGASGAPIPDKATIAAWIGATSVETAGVNRWIVNRTQDPATKALILTASIVQSVSSAAYPEQPDLYRLTVTCRVNTREGQVQLLWSPGSPTPGQEVSAVVDGKGPFQYRVEGTEKMGNGNGGSSGPGAIVLFATKESSPRNASALSVAMPLPAQTLTIGNLIQNETIAFPFSDLTQTARQQLSPCFATNATAQ